MRADELAKKPFKKFDIIVYVAILLITVLLFLPTLKRQEYSGFEVLVENKVVFSYDYARSSYVIYGDSVKKISPTVFKISANGGYNEITIDTKKKKVYVTDTDCGITKECTQMGGRNVIICVPHKLVIRETADGESIKVG